MAKQPVSSPPKPSKNPDAAQLTRKIARRGSRQIQRAFRQFAPLIVDTVRSTLGFEQRRVTRYSNRSTTGRLINEIISIAETQHLGGQHVDLSQVLVEPRFLLTPQVAEPVAEDEAVTEVYYVIPHLPDLPHLSAPYNPPSLRIENLAAGYRRVAIVGTPGSGRTTALMAFALWAMRALEFEEPDDPLKARLAAEEAALSEMERQERARKKQELLAAAREQLENAIKQGEVPRVRATNAKEAAAEAERAALGALPFNELVPAIIHMGDLYITPQEFGNQADPAEPLVRAIQRRVGTLTARTIPGLIYERLEQNRMLLFMDGFDELPPTDQPRLLLWLKAFLAQYGNNFIVVTAPARGYGVFTSLDFTPVFIKPWTPLEVNSAIEKWQAVWPQVTKTRDKDGEAVPANQVKHAVTDTFGLSLAEITLKIWAAFSSADNLPTIGEWVQSYLAAHLPPNTPYDKALDVLRLAATIQIDNGFITARSLDMLAEAQAAGKATDQSLDSSQLAAATEGEVVADPYDEDDEDDATNSEQVARRQLLRGLTFSGLLVTYRGGRYRFRHSILADYLASFTLTPLPQSDPASLYTLAQKPTWRWAVAFAAAHTDLHGVAQMKLAANPDLFYSDWLDMLEWLRHVKGETTWRAEVLNRLLRLFVDPNGFIVAKERIIAGMLHSRDVAAAVQFIEGGLGSGDIDTVRMVCLASGGLGRHGRRFIPELIEAIGLPEQDIHIAAAHALSALGTEEAKDALAGFLEQGGERLQQAIAEALAGLPEEGYQTLFDTQDIDGEDQQSILLRRAGVFGLRRIQKEWSNDRIRQVFLRESQFMVRVIAQEAFLQQQAGVVGLTPLPNPEDIYWIRHWAERRGLIMDTPNQAKAALAETLKDQNKVFRALGALALGQLGIVQAVRPLYVRLTDDDRAVRQAAYRALTTLQLVMGQPLPNPL
ncbi:MAG: HEAT repeat domain-containing protein [Phototrophicaceae bacterium]